MVLRPKSKASLPSHRSYTRVDVEPQQEHQTGRARAHDKGSRFLGSLLKRVLVVVAVLAPVVFLLIWKHLFAIDVSSILVESRSGSSIEKTFTVR